jgi:hypothetical protein
LKIKEKREKNNKKVVDAKIKVRMQHALSWKGKAIEMI